MTKYFRALTLRAGLKMDHKLVLALFERGLDPYFRDKLREHRLGAEIAGKGLTFELRDDYLVGLAALAPGGQTAAAVAGGGPDASRVCFSFRDTGACRYEHAGPSNPLSQNDNKVNLKLYSPFLSSNKCKWTEYASKGAVTHDADCDWIVDS